jgi:hypothetical protein
LIGAVNLPSALPEDFHIWGNARQSGGGETGIRLPATPWWIQASKQGPTRSFTRHHFDAGCRSQESKIDIRR